MKGGNTCANVQLYMQNKMSETEKLSYARNN